MKKKSDTKTVVKRQRKSKKTGMTEYLILHKDGTERKITVPDDWKVTFGPVCVPRGGEKYGGGSSMPLALRFYESDTKQRAIFTNVASFRDLSIKTEVKKVTVSEKNGFVECEGQRKATIFQAKTEEWVDPDQPQKQNLLPDLNKGVFDED